MCLIRQAHKDPQDDRSLLRLAATLAQQAGAAILTIRARGFATRLKDDGSPVTAADLASEAVILAGLSAGTPEIPVIAEESAIGRDETPPSEFWLVDPLDGTREFAAGIDEFVINIGLIRSGRAVIGVVYAPALQELFGGIVGYGACKRTRGGQVSVRARLPPSSGLVVLASRHDPCDPQTERRQHGPDVSEVLKMGSALKFCRIAEGLADRYVRSGRTMEWDTAAPQAIVEAAEGRVRLLDGGLLTYGKPGWANPSFRCEGRSPTLR